MTGFNAFLYGVFVLACFAIYILLMAAAAKWAWSYLFG